MKLSLENNILYIDGEHFHQFCTDYRQLNRFTSITKHSSQVSFILYCILFMASVLTLKQGLIRYQLGQMMWSIVTVCLVVFQCKFFASNVMNGLFWFLFPACTVVSILSQ